MSLGALAGQEVEIEGTPTSHSLLERHHQHPWTDGRLVWEALEHMKAPNDKELVEKGKC